MAKRPLFTFREHAQRRRIEHWKADIGHNQLQWYGLIPFCFNIEMAAQASSPR